MICCQDQRTPWVRVTYAISYPFCGFSKRGVTKSFLLILWDLFPASLTSIWRRENLLYKSFWRALTWIKWSSLTLLTNIYSTYHVVGQGLSSDLPIHISRSSTNKKLPVLFPTKGLTEQGVWNSKPSFMPGIAVSCPFRCRYTWTIYIVRYWDDPYRSNL